VLHFEKQVELVAGPATALFTGDDLRAMRIAGSEVINRIYFALRDHNWTTIPGRISELRVDRGDDRFLITYCSEHRDREVNFLWRATITGEPNGTIRFAVEGEPRSTFRRNRIGLCVHHPISAAGDQLIVTHPDGSTTSGTFPTIISAHQPFKEIAGIRHFLSNGIFADIQFHGDVFEMEDQRNWTDANFKTYSTPLRLPFPVEVRASDQVRQSVTVSPVLAKESSSGYGHKTDVRRRGAGLTNSTRQVNTVTLGSPSGRMLVPFGLSWSRDAKELTEDEYARLAALRLSHLYLELVLGDEHCVEDLAAAADCGRRIGAPIAAALRIETDAGPGLDRLFRALEHARPQVAAWTVLSEGPPTTSAEHLSIVRERLSRGGYCEPIGGGTRAFFAELNRTHPAIDLLDFVSYRVSPQIHADDELSIVENLGGQRATVESALVLSRGKPVHVGPVTLKMQWNPYATAPPQAPAPDELPPDVDPRQRLAFAAAWTLGSVKTLSEAGALRATYYEMIGWKGIMEHGSGSPLPSLFPSRPGELFPLYHLFAALGDVAGGEIHTVVITDPGSLSGLAVRKDSLLRLFVANYKPVERRVRIEGPSGASEMYLLGSETEPVAHPSVSGKRPELVLGPYEVLWIDQRIATSA
jgi:D-apionolactonase